MKTRLCILIAAATLLLAPRARACCDMPLNVTTPAALDTLSVQNPTAAHTWCADAVNGNDANSGAATGTYPHLTNCKLHLSNACNLLTSGDLLLTTGVFHDATKGTSAVVSGTNVLCTVPTTSGGAAFTTPTVITSYGPPLQQDELSGASVGMFADGGDCIGAMTGSCAGQGSTPTWTLFSSTGGVNIYSTPFTQQPVAMYLDDITTWPDGPNADGAQGLIQATCVSGTCPNNPTTGALWPLWAAGAVGAGACRQYSTNNITQLFCTTAGGTAAVPGPSCQGVNTCQAGTTTETDGGGVVWTFEGGSGGKIGAMTTGSWFWDGQKIYISTPANDTPANHIVSAADHWQGLYMNANGAGGNNYTIENLGIRHTQDGLLWRNNSSSVLTSGVQVLFSIIEQTGESNVDLTNFANGVRFASSETAATLPANPVLFQHNYEAFNGDHGGQTTVQAGINGMVIDYNHYHAGNHASVNLVGGGGFSSAAVMVQSNFIDTNGPTANQAVANDSVAGIYQTGSNGFIVGNYIYNQFGSYCVAGQCTCINVQTGSGNTIMNNTCNDAQACLYTSGSSGTVYVGNVCGNLHNFSATGIPIITHTGEITTSNYNVLTSLTTVAGVSGVNKTMAQWQALGFDANSLNQDASYSTGDFYPWTLNAASPGVGLTFNQNAYSVNAGANPFNYGWQQ